VNFDIALAILVEVGHQPATRQPVSDDGVRDCDVEQDRPDPLRSVTLHHYLAHGAEFLTIELEGDERDWEGQRPTALDDAADSTHALSRQADTNHPDSKDGDRS
jgi:hypothetical protein